MSAGNETSDRSSEDRPRPTLAVAELHFCQLVENVRDYAIFLLDANGNVVTWNQGAEQIKGYRSDEIIGKHFSIFYTPEARGENKPGRGLEIAKSQGRFEDEGWRVRKDSSRFWASVTVTWVPSAEPTLGRFLKITRDLSARKEAEAANYAKDRVLAVLSHELRTPLTPILFACSMLIEDPSLPETVRVTARMIAKNAKLQARLLDGLLDATKLTAGKLRLKFTIVDVHALLHSVAEIFAQELETKQLKLSLDLAATNHVLQADSDRLQQVFWNLLNNAIKFTPSEANIFIRSTNPGTTSLRVEVQDSGKGISPALLPKIFAPFEQDESSDGLGLGLAITKSIVDLHGGRITAASAGPGKGATFTVQLPTA